MRKALLLIALLLNMALPVVTIAATCSGNGVPIGVPLIGNNKCVGGNGRNPIYGYLNTAIQLASAVVGLAVVLSIVFAALQYVTSQGNPSEMAAAKNRLTNAIIGLLLFIFMYGILNLLVQGGALR